MSASFPESLVLGDSGEGAVITGTTDNTITAKSGLKDEDDIVAATINLDNFNRNEVLRILEVLKPYENNMRVVTKKDVNTSGSIDSLALGLKNPAGTLLKKDLSVDASAETPTISLDGPDGKINTAHGFGGEISSPIWNGDLPKHSLKKASADASTVLTVPSTQLAEPDTKVGLGKSPAIPVPSAQINTSHALLDTEKPGNLKHEAPKFMMPHFDLPLIEMPKAELNVSGDADLPSVSGHMKTPDLNMSSPKLDVASSDFDLEGPKVDMKGPDLNLKTPNADIKATSGKINWPHLRWKSRKVKEPDAKINADLNADLSTPDANISTPKIDADLSAPDVDISLPKTDIKGPDVDVQSPGLDVDAPSGKINWPHLKWKKTKFHGSKADLDLDANLNAPDVELSAPKVEGELDVTDIDVNSPKPNIKGGDLDVQAPNIDVEAPSSKISWPHLKWKKPKLQGPNSDFDLDAELNTPDLNLMPPKIEGDINVPNAELNLPKARIDGPDADIKGPDLDIDAPSGKINWPHLKWKKPKVHGPKAETDGELELPKADINASAPDIDIDTPSAKIKWPTVKKPKWSFSQPGVNVPDVDLDAEVSTPDLDLSAPKIDGEINKPDVNVSLPEPELNAPQIDISAPNVNIDGPSAKPKWFILKKPKFGTLKGPKTDIDPDVKVPDVDLKGPDVDVSTPDVNLYAPKISGGIETDLDVNLPDSDVKGPNVNLNGLDLDIEPFGTKLKSPKFKLPKLVPKVPKVKGSDMDVDLKAPDTDISLDLPKVDVDAPEVDLKAPDLSLAAPKIEASLDAPNHDVYLPRADVKGPNVDIQASDDASAGKFRLPKMKLPKFGLSGPKVKEPNVDGDMDLKTPDLSLPDVDAKLLKTDITVPEVDLKAPDTNANFDFPKVLDATKVDPKAQDLSLAAPKIDGNLSTLNTGVKLPKAELGIPEVTAKSPHVDINLPKADLKGPHAQLKTPDLDLDPHLGEFNMPRYKLPNLDLSVTNIENSSVQAKIKKPKVDINTPTADANISVPAVELNAPKLEGDFKGPKVDTNLANGDNNLEKSKVSNFKFPKFSISGSKTKSPEINTNPRLETDDDVESETDESMAEMEVPTFKIHRLPTYSIDGIGEIADATGVSKLDSEEKDYVVSKGIRLPIVNATSKSGDKINIMERLKMAKEKAFSSNVSPSEVKTNLDLKLGSPSLDISASKEAGDSSLLRGGTFKAEKPKSVQGLEAPGISTSDENEKLSLGLSNMLGLNIKDCETD